MPFREKRAWISFITILLVSSIYFTYLVIVTHSENPPRFHYLAHLALVAVFAFVLLDVALHVGLYWLSPVDSRMPRDERELLIEFKATRIAFTTLVMLSMMVAAVIVHVNGDYWLLGNIVIMAVVISELVNYGMRILYYRRGI